MKRTATVLLALIAVIFGSVQAAGARSAATLGATVSGLWPQEVVSVAGCGYAPGTVDVTFPSGPSTVTMEPVADSTGCFTIPELGFIVSTGRYRVLASQNGDRLAATSFTVS